MGRLLAQLFEITALFDMRLRPELVLLQKTMVTVEGVARRIDPDHDIWAAAEPVVRRWIARELSPAAARPRSRRRRRARRWPRLARMADRAAPKRRRRPPRPPVDAAAPASALWCFALARRPAPPWPSPWRPGSR